MDLNTNFEQGKTWHELYREEQERLNRENTVRKSKQLGLLYSGKIKYVQKMEE